MSNEKDTTNTPPMEIPELTPAQIESLKALKKALHIGQEKPRSERGITFGFVAQADESGQMDVVRWLRDDYRYRVVTILHDRDTHDEESIEKLRKKGIAEDELPKVGDSKKPHYHGIVRVGSKITAQSLAKRFGGYLHFELLHDPSEYAHYMLHATFNSRDKARYYHGELLDDVAFWDELADSDREQDICGKVSRVAAYLENGEISVDKMLQEGDAIALRSIMAHSYFYATFINKKSKKEESNCG